MHTRTHTFKMHTRSSRRHPFTQYTQTLTIHTLNTNANKHTIAQYAHTIYTHTRSKNSIHRQSCDVTFLFLLLDTMNEHLSIHAKHTERERGGGSERERVCVYM